MTRKLDISEEKWKQKKQKQKKKTHQWYCIGPLVREQNVKDKILYRWLDIRLEHSIWF